MKIRMLKLPFETKHFRKNQKLFVVYMSGNLACLCCGKYKGHGKRIRAWISWESKQRQAPMFFEAEINEQFYNQIMGV